MSMQLRLRISLGVLIGLLLVIAFVSALQFRELAYGLVRVPAEPELAQQLAGQSLTAALGLALTGLLGLIIGVSITRALRHTLLDRLMTIDVAASEILAGERARRMTVDGSDELARIARTIDILLDQSARREAELRGHNREARALLVALLHQSPKPAAVIGIDGEIIVSTLSAEADQILHSLTPRVRAAAKILLSRGFLTAAELSTDINTNLGRVRIQALALGEQRIVGWLAVFDELPSAPALAEAEDAVEPEPAPTLTETKSEPALGGPSAGSAI
jgi:hypothetical protein